MKCKLCPMRVGKVLTEEELKELLAYHLIMPDYDVCKYKRGDECQTQK